MRIVTCFVVNMFLVKDTNHEHYKDSTHPIGCEPYQWRWAVRVRVRVRASLINGGGLRISRTLLSS